MAKLASSLTQALVLTDDTELRNQLSGALVENGLEVLPADDGGPASGMSPGGALPPLTFLDLDMTSAVGDGFLEEYLEALNGRTLVVLASEQSIPRLITAVESGASAYLKKPLVRGEVRVVLGHVKRLRREALASHAGGLFGASPEIQTVRKLVDQAAESGSHVIVMGEPGVGKRLVGRLIHQNSRRRSDAFVQLSCAGFQEDVLENLLFGSDAPGGDDRGHLASCAGGTLLIDDIDLLPPRVQERLLRSLRPQAEAGSPAPPDGARVIAVSSRSLAGEVRAGAFDPGLFDLLNRVRIDVPSLRHRKSDIPILADHFSRSAAQASHKPSEGIHPALLVELMRYDWPGNVRELEDVLEQAVQSSRGGALAVRDCPALPEAVDTIGPGPRIPGSTIHEIEKDAILRTLESTGGSTSKAARILEMSVRKIQYKLKEYRIEASAIAAVESLPSAARPKSRPRSTEAATASRH